MPHLPPLSRDAVPQFKERFEHYENTRGFIPNSILTMSRRPAIAAAFMQLNKVVLDDLAYATDLWKRLLASEIIDAQDLAGHQNGFSGQRPV